MFKAKLAIGLALTLAACAQPVPGPDINAIATDVAGTLQAAASATIEAAPSATPTTRVIPTFTDAPPPSPTPEDGRISFATGATQGVATGQVQANQRESFWARAAQNQVMVAQLFTPAGNAVLEIVGADGSTLLPASRGWNSYRSVLTRTQDYEFRVVGGSSTQDFTLSVTFAVPVQFASGASSATYSGRTVGGYPVSYGIYVQSNQRLNVTVNTNPNDAALTIWGFNDGTPYARAQNGVTNFSQSMPTTQYYLIEVVPQGGREVNFQVTIGINN